MSRIHADRFRPAKGVFARKCDGELVLLHLDEGMYFALNEQGTEVWHHIVAGRTTDEIAGLLVEEYEIDRATAERDVRSLIANLLAARLLDPDANDASGEST